MSSRRSAVLVVLGVTIASVGVGLALDKESPSRLTRRLPAARDGPVDVVFVSDRFGIRGIWSLHAGDLSRLSRSGVEAYAPALASDGTLAFVEHVDGFFDVIVSPVDGTPRRVVRSPGPVGRIAWASDGHRLVFDRLVIDGQRIESEIVVHDLRDGTEHVSLRRPGWSLGGVAWRHGREEIAVVEVDTTPSRIVFVDPASGDPIGEALEGATSPAWDPEGRRLAFVRSTKRGWEVALGGERGQQARVLVRRRQLLFAPTWAGDQRLVFEYYEANPAPDLWTVDVVTGDLNPVVQHPGFDGLPAGR